MNNIRMNWLDAARIAAAFCIVAIHASTNAIGQPFPDAQPGERLFPVLFRTTAELASTEYFILVSLFLLAFKMDRKPGSSFMETMRIQARRLLVPFAFWTVFYALFKLLKAYQFNYVDGMLTVLSNPSNWVDYFLLGTSQYHMHFLPTLFLLIMFYPLYLLAGRHPVLGLTLLPLLFMRDFFDGWLWEHVKNPHVLEYLARMVKVFCYVGYGMAAYAMYGWWKQQTDRDTTAKIFMFAGFMLVLLFVIKLIQSTEIIASGDYGLRTGAFYYAHFTIPVFSLLLFMSSQHFNWPDRLSQWSKYTFAIYLIHPAVIHSFDLFMHGTELSPAVYVAIRYFVAVTGSVCIAWLISRISFMAWTIGLGPLPFSKKSTKQKDSIVSGHNEAAAR